MPCLCASLGKLTFLQVGGQGPQLWQDGNYGGSTAVPSNLTQGLQYSYTRKTLLSSDLQCDDPLYRPQ